MKITGSIKYLIIGSIVAFLGWMLVESLSQPGVKDLQGKYEQVVFQRNENNTGPVVRVYAVMVEDTLFSEMEQYGNFMPHNKYGNTRVYFFSGNTAVPDQIALTEEELSPLFKANCIAKYEKDAMGQVSLVKYPFR